MELRHLRYYVAAAEAENVSRAALKLHVSQPALSRQIRDLEEELGFPLFERSAKAVRLTPAGQRFLNEARAVLQRADEAVKAAREVATGNRAELNVGYAPSPTVRVLPAALRAFQEVAPEVRVRLHDLSTGEMLAGLQEGRLHLAFMVRPSRVLLRRLHFEELIREPMCMAVSPRHPLARLRSIPQAEAANQAFVVFSRKEYPDYHDYLQRLFAPSGVNPRIVEEHDSSSSLIAAVESGAGVALVPKSFDCFAGPRLKLLTLVPTPEPLVIGAVWAKEHLTALAEKFWKVTRQAVSGMK